MNINDDLLEHVALVSACTRDNTQIECAYRANIWVALKLCGAGKRCEQANQMRQFLLHACGKPLREKPNSPQEN
jgi:hypothetical protein